MKTILLVLIVSLFIFGSCTHDSWRVRNLSNNTIMVIVVDKGFEIGDTITWSNTYSGTGSRDSRYILLKKVGE